MCETGQRSGTSLQFHTGGSRFVSGRWTQTLLALFSVIFLSPLCKNLYSTSIKRLRLLPDPLPLFIYATPQDASHPVQPTLLKKCPV
jgi:hypothetical protein